MHALRPYAEYFGIALAASLLLTLLVRAVARRLGFVAKPRPDRWHSKPTALYGGIAIYGGFLTAYLVHRPPGVGGDALLVLCASGMFVLGLVDDRFQLKPYAKLIGQIACAAVVTTWGLHLHWLTNEILDRALTIFWLVGVTNALNLLDNIDGAAGGVAAIAALFLVYFCHTQGLANVGELAAAFAGGVIGFLVFNVNPASIFMGDCGSLFLGFFLGGVSIVGGSAVSGARRNILAVLSIPVLLLLIPILDTTLVTIARRYHGRRVSQGGRDHTSHRLVALGLSERQATFTIWGIAAASGGVAVLVQSLSAAVALGILAVFLFGLLFLMIFLGRVRVYEPVASEDEGAGRLLLPTLADFSYKRRIFETLNDLAMIILAYYGAFLLRFEGAPDPTLLSTFALSLPIVIVAQLAVFLAAGLYHGVWRYTGMEDLLRIVKAVLLATLFSTVALLLVFRFDGLSRAVMVIDAVLLLLGVAGSRASFRLLHSWLTSTQPTEGRRVLIYGAGDGGELLLRELKQNRDLGLIPVGFLDDDRQKAGRVIHGVAVVGTSEDLAVAIERTKAQELVVSTVKIDAERSSRVRAACAAAGLAFRTMRITFE